MGAKLAITATLIASLLVQPLALWAMPCCCTTPEISAKSCCAHHSAGAQRANKSCCAKHGQPAVKLHRGCCCCIEQAPANLPARDAYAKPQAEQLVGLPLSPLALPAAQHHRPLQRVEVSPPALPPSVNVLFCTWQI